MPATSAGLTDEMPGAFSSAEHRGNLLTTTQNDDTPTAVGCAGQTFKVARLVDGFAIDFLDDVAALKAEIACIRACIDIHDRYTLFDVLQLQFVGERGRKVGDLDARKRRARTDHDFITRRCRGALQTHCHCLFAPRSYDAKTCTAAERFSSEAIVKGVRIIDILSVHRNDKIACLDPGTCRRTVGTDVGDQCAGGTP